LLSSPAPTGTDKEAGSGPAGLCTGDSRALQGLPSLELVCRRLGGPRRCRCCPRRACSCRFGSACRPDTPTAAYTDKWRTRRGKNRTSADQLPQLLPTVDYKLSSVVCARPASPCVPARPPDTLAPRLNMSASGQLAAATQSNQSAPRAVPNSAYRAEPSGRSLKASLHEAVP
jgi:hypothetical protein